MGTAAVSVVIPTFNRAAYLTEALTSVICQGNVVREIVVVDDGSTDDTRAVLDAVAEPRLKVLAQDRKGPAAARNHGWHAAQSEWIAFLDSDDSFAPGALDSLLAAAHEQPGCIPSGRATLHVYEFDQPPYSELAMTRRNGWIARDFCRLPLATIFACLFPRSLLMELGGFSEEPALHFAEDFDLGLRVAMARPFVFVDRVCYRIRMHGENRHATVQLAVLAAVAHSADMRLRARGGYHGLHRRFRGTLENVSGSEYERMGNRAAARRCYLRSLRWWPFKWRSIRGLTRTGLWS
jgi:glycosyltransferase involved in cell wall biosynthesis